jgi:uncharacterized protein (DUF1786 family)
MILRAVACDLSNLSRRSGAIQCGNYELPPDNLRFQNDHGDTEDTEKNYLDRIYRIHMIKKLIRMKSKPNRILSILYILSKN